MLRSFGFPELLIVFCVLLALLIVPAILYLISLQRALERCSPEARTTAPGSVWLLLIPLFNLVWQFLLVDHIAKSLRNEFVRRSLPTAEAEPGKRIGMALSILSAASLIPFVGFATSIAGFVCWILYWVKISGYSRALQLNAPPARV